MLLAVFIYWGWDTCRLGERGDQGPGAHPGACGGRVHLLLLAIYSMVTVAAQAFSGIGDTGIGLGNPDNAGDVLSVLGHAVFGSSIIGAGLTKLLILMVLSSAAASTLTTILPTARTTLSMAVFQAIPANFKRIHPRHLTPTWSTVGMGLASIVFYVILVRLSPNVLGDTVASIGLLIAFYYGMTGFACVWFFRHELFRSGKDLLVKGILPLVGAVILLTAFVRAAIDYANPDYGTTSWTLPFPPHWHLGGVFLTGIGSLVVGLVLMLVYNAIAPDFFAGRVLRRDTPTPEVTKEG